MRATRWRAARPPLVSDLRLTVLCLVGTVLTSVLMFSSLGDSVLRELDRGWWPGLRSALVMSSVAALVYGSLVYQLTRVGWLRRLHSFRRVPQQQLDADIFGPRPEPLVVLVPSYREDPRVVRQTLLSAALQDYPRRRVVLLLDDPPTSREPSTDEVRALPGEIEALLAPLAAQLHSAWAAFRTRVAQVGLNFDAELVRLSVLVDAVARWFETRAAAEEQRTHIDQHFVAITFQARARELREVAARLRRTVGVPPDREVLEVGYRRLAGVFQVSLEVFERKRFDNLSHEPNKAMNLNAYLGLLGGAYQVVVEGNRRLLCPAMGEPDLVVPDAPWVLTLDADSVLVHYYASRLLYRLREPDMARTAVIQTPYSSVPGSPSLVERTAGATTDLTYVLHQGLTAFDATFWVGANALLRKAALQDIVTYTKERGHLVPRFIQDRTVIEDTESSVDLAVRGWRLHNYPQRLAYSATPPDYGSLLIQRRRWANGGLIILPKLLRHVLSDLRPRTWLTAWLRVHYLVSTPLVNLSLLVLMSLPYPEALVPPLLPVLCVPYFLLYARDLRLAGHRARDLVHVYVLNLLLTPVNLGGVLKSVQQAVTGKRIPFGRTPKVTTRTPVPALYLVSTLGLLALWSMGAVHDVASGRETRGAVAAVNAVALGYGVTRFIGWRACLADLGLSWRERWSRRVGPPPAAPAGPPLPTRRSASRPGRARRHRRQHRRPAPARRSGTAAA